MRWHPGGRVHSVSRDPGRTQTKWLRWASATPPPPRRWQLAEPQRLSWIQSTPQSPSVLRGGAAWGAGVGVGAKGWSGWRLLATVPDVLHPPSSPPATPTLAPRPPVAACPGLLFLFPPFLILVP